MTPRNENINAVVYIFHLLVLESSSVTHGYIMNIRVAILYVVAIIVQQILLSFCFLCIVSF